MKIVKTIGCLALLCVIICGCIAMAKRGDAATATPDETPVGEANATPQPDSRAISLIVMASQPLSLVCRRYPLTAPATTPLMMCFWASR